MDELNKTELEKVTTKKLSSDRVSNSKIGKDYAGAIWGIINRDRKLRGWKPKDFHELKEQILSWYEILFYKKIPVDALPELYLRARDIQINDQREGREPAELTATLLASCWPGYQEEWYRKAVESGRILPDKAKAGCEECGGTGMREVTRNGVRGVVRCRHGI